MKNVSIFAAVFIATSVLYPDIGVADPSYSDRMARLGYLSGIASTHYCACSTWPSSWSQLVRFDAKLRGESERKGVPPAPPFPWTELSKSTIQVASDGLLDCSIRGLVDKPVDIRIPKPDCSDFKPEVVRHLCGEVSR